MVLKRDKNIPMIKSKVIRSNMVKGDKIIDFQFLSENFIPLIIGNELFLLTGLMLFWIILLTKKIGNYP